MTFGIPETTSETYGIKYIKKVSNSTMEGQDQASLRAYDAKKNPKTPSTKPSNYEKIHEQYITGQNKKPDTPTPHEQGVNYYSSGMGDKSKLVPEAHKKYEGETSNMENVHSVPHAVNSKTGKPTQVLTHEGKEPETKQRQPEGEYKPNGGKPYTISPVPVKHHVAEGEINEPQKKVEKMQYNNYIISGMSPMIAKLTMINRTLDELFKGARPRSKLQRNAEGKLLDQTTGLPMQPFNPKADNAKTGSENKLGESKGQDGSTHPEVPSVTDALAYIKDTKEKEPIKSFNEGAPTPSKTPEQKKVIADANARKRDSDTPPPEEKFDANTVNDPNDKRYYASGKKPSGTGKGGSYR